MIGELPRRLGFPKVVACSKRFSGGVVATRKCDDSF
jgi:hypothetical protein